MGFVTPAALLLAGYRELLLLWVNMLSRGGGGVRGRGKTTYRFTFAIFSLKEKIS